MVRIFLRNRFLYATWNFVITVVVLPVMHAPAAPDRQTRPSV
jgi:hypothetical protein